MLRIFHLGCLRKRREVQWGWNEGELRVVVQFVRGGIFFCKQIFPFACHFLGVGKEDLCFKFFYFSALDEVDNFFKKLTLDNILAFKKVMNCYSGILVYHGFTQTPLSVLFLIVPQMTPYPNPLTLNPQSEVGKEEIFRKSFQP